LVEKTRSYFKADCPAIGGRGRFRLKLLRVGIMGLLSFSIVDFVVVVVGLGLIMEKRGQVCALPPKKIRFAVAEFDVDEDFAIEHDLILWLGKVMNDRSSGKKHLFKCKFG